MNNVETELRNLLDSYWDRYLSLAKDKEDCLDDEEKTINKVLQRQCRIMVAELFRTMKNLNLLDAEEIEMGAVKKR